MGGKADVIFFYHAHKKLWFIKSKRDGYKALCLPIILAEYPLLST